MKEKVEIAYAKQKGYDNYKGCKAYNDFRELLALKDIDAVVISSPQHWHGLHMTQAALAGKDIYGEKALTISVRQGRTVCDTVRKLGRVFQVGTQQRSDSNFHYACELVRNEYIGELKAVKVKVPGGSVVPSSTITKAPKGFDYDMWLGPAPSKPYCANRTNTPIYPVGGWNHPWYHQYDFCVGWINAWGVHHLDIALWGAPEFLTSPLEVSGKAIFPTEGIADTSLTWDVNFRTKSGLRMNFTDSSDNSKIGTRFQGTHGWIHVNRRGIWAEPDSLLSVRLKPNDIRLPLSRHHWQNFLDCLKNRHDPVSNVESGHYATTLGTIADIATRVGEKLMWDWKTERFANQDFANRMLSRTMRSPWHMYE
jgi:predicted dehydrogenase